MKTSNIARLYALQNLWWFRAALIAVLFLFSLVGLFNISFSVRGDAIPGGNIANPAVRVVEIAKPAVVRIITTIGGRITVHLPNAQSKEFPLHGGTYKLKLSGSGTFISSHGDVLTADHVINPPHDQQLDFSLQAMAAQDIADDMNHALTPANKPYTRESVLGDLKSGHLASQSHYDNPTSEIYLNTSSIGLSNSSNWLALPPGAHAAIDKVEMESAGAVNDLAIVHARMENTLSVQLGNSSAVAPQDTLMIIGFPANIDLDHPVLPGPDVLLTPLVNETVVSAVKNTPDGIPVIEVGGAIEEGASGAPALDRDGHIVGIVSSHKNQDPKNQHLSMETSFLQVSNAARDMVQALALDTTPGPLQKAWSQAMSDYASTTPGHWHKALSEFQLITAHFPLFQGMNSYLRYTRLQASREQPSISQLRDTDNRWLLIGGGAVTVMILFVAILLVGFLLSQARKKVAAVPVEEQLMEVPPVAPSPAAAPFPIPSVAPEPADPVLSFAPSPPPPSEAVPVLQEQEPGPPIAPVTEPLTVEQVDFDGTPLVQDTDWNQPTDPKLPAVHL